MVDGSSDTMFTHRTQPPRRRRCHPGTGDAIPVMVRDGPWRLTTGMSPHRLEAFSDGVLAIAVTLLVLDLHVPDDPGRPLGELLLAQWPLLPHLRRQLRRHRHHVGQPPRAVQPRRADRPPPDVPQPGAAAGRLRPAVPHRRGRRRACGGVAGTPQVALFTYSAAMFLVAIAFTSLWRHIVRTPGAPAHAPVRRRAAGRGAAGSAGPAGLRRPCAARRSSHRC